MPFGCTRPPVSLWVIHSGLRTAFCPLRWTNVIVEARTGSYQWPYWASRFQASSTPRPKDAPKHLRSRSGRVCLYYAPFRRYSIPSLCRATLPFVPASPGWRSHESLFSQIFDQNFKVKNFLIIQLRKHGEKQLKSAIVAAVGGNRHFARANRGDGSSRNSLREVPLWTGKARNGSRTAWIGVLRVFWGHYW